MSTPSNHPDGERVIVSGPAALIAAVPYMLGFHPTESLVVIGIEAEAERGKVVGSLRIDLPTRETADIYESAIRQLVAALRTMHTDAILVVLSPRSDPRTIPHRDVIDLCGQRFADAGIAVVATMWAADTHAGSEWASYDDPDSAGVLPGTDTTTLAAVAAYQGLVVHNSRSEMSKLLTPDPDDALARRRRLLDDAHADQRRGFDAAATLQRLHDVRAAVDAAEAGRLPKTDAEIVTLTIALKDHVVRDMCMLRESGSRGEAAAQLWQRLACATPAPERADATAMFAASMFQVGDGPLARVALEIAQSADPRHRLTELLNDCITIMTPTRLQSLLADAASRSAEVLRRAQADRRGHNETN